MLRIKDIKKYSPTLNFMVEFINEMKKEEIDFENFMEIMYGSIEKFKKCELINMEEDFKSICYYLDKYYEIVEKVSEGDNE